MTLPKKFTRYYNWFSSLGNKKNWKGKCQRGRRTGSCRTAFLPCPACLGSFNEPPHLWGKLASAFFYVQPLTLGKWPRSTGNEISNDVDYSKFQPSERSGTFLKFLMMGFDLCYFYGAITEHQGNMWLAQQE